jgi:hypothetical protein
VTYDGEEGPVAIPLDAGVQTQSVPATQAVVADNNDNDDDTVIEVRRKNPAIVQQAVAAPGANLHLIFQS